MDNLVGSKRTFAGSRHTTHAVVRPCIAQRFDATTIRPLTRHETYTDLQVFGLWAWLSALWTVCELSGVNKGICGWSRSGGPLSSRPHVRGHDTSQRAKHGPCKGALGFRATVQLGCDRSQLEVFAGAGTVDSKGTVSNTTFTTTWRQPRSTSCRYNSAMVLRQTPSCESSMTLLSCCTSCAMHEQRITLRPEGPLGYLDSKCNLEWHGSLGVP